MKTKRKILPKLLTLLCLIIFTAGSYSQNIINTVGTSGIFRIKDGVNTFFTLTQSNGYIELNKSLKLAETTDLNTGIIYKGNDRFIHNFRKPTNFGQNTFVGINSGNFTMGGPLFSDGSSNTALGYGTLNKVTTGYRNTALGNSALASNTTGINNVGIGPYTLEFNISGSHNIGIGDNSLNANTIGSGNVSIGIGSLELNTDGINNVSLGLRTMEENIHGGENVAIGKLALSENTDGSSNTALGSSALGNSTGNNNTALGYNSGLNLTTGQNVTTIGYNSQPSTGSSNNQITLGNNQVTSLRCNVQTITSLSDGRDKKNVKALSLGLSFIMKLQPREFNWDKREWYEGNLSDGSKTEEAPTAGFIAQELDEAQTLQDAEWLKLVFKDNPEKWEATYGNLLPVMVKAIQELKEENDIIKTENEKLRMEIESLKSVEERMTMLELTLLKDKTLKEIKSAQR
jgi:trimeric autotransporter adhesin